MDNFPGLFNTAEIYAIFPSYFFFDPVSVVAYL